MSNQSPLYYFESVARGLAERFPLPDWLVEESQRRIVLLLNHVLQQEPAAVERLLQLRGSTLLVQWQAFTLRLIATPAGLLDLAPEHSPPDLTLQLTSDSVWDLAQSVVRRERPSVQIDGDVRLAGELNWLVEHVRWDLEEDLARIVGDPQAHMLAGIARQIAEALRGLVAAAASRSGRAA